MSLPRIQQCPICFGTYVERLCQCQRNSYRGWSIWIQGGQYRGSQYGVTANSQTLEGLRLSIDYHIQDRAEWFAGRNNGTI